MLPAILALFRLSLHLTGAFGGMLNRITWPPIIIGRATPACPHGIPEAGYIKFK